MNTPLHLDKLAALPDNWDSYGALRITPQAIETARVLIARMDADADAPHVVPTSKGGVQLEWSSREQVGWRSEVEIEIGPSGRVIDVWVSL